MSSQPLDRRRRPIPAVARHVPAALWILAAIVIALGAAGIVAGMEGATTDPDRSGRTAREDALVGSHLDAVETDLRTVAGLIHELGAQGRGALAAATGNDTDAAAAAVATGTGLLADIEVRTAAIRTALEDVPIVDASSAAYRLSPAVRDRYLRAIDALAATTDLAPSWSGLTIGSLTASRLSGLLADHDAAVALAAEHGRAGEYDEALAALDGADTAITDARTMRDRLALSIDVTTLDQWLERSSGYDVALRRLYVAVRAADGAATDDVRAALAAEQAAKARLPPDTRALVLIMAEIGRGGLHGAVIAIERAHGDLLEALDPPVAGPSP